MSPNPYRTTLLAFALIGLVPGGILLLLLVVAPNLEVRIVLAAIAPVLLSSGLGFLTIWLIVSAIIFGIKGPDETSESENENVWGVAASTSPRQSSSQLDADDV